MFFFPGTTIPCLSHQYGEGHRLLLKRMNVSDLSVSTPRMEDLKALIGIEIGARLWRGLVAADLLMMFHRNRQARDLNALARLATIETR